MKKKLITLLLTSTLAVAALAGCGAETGTSTTTTSTEASTEASTEEASTEDGVATETSEEVTDDAKDAEEKTEGSADTLTLLDVTADMVDTGAHGVDADNTELTFTMFKGNDSKDYVALISFDQASETGEVICGTYEASTETDKDGNEWTYFDVTDAYTGDVYKLGISQKPDTDEISFLNKGGDVIKGQKIDQDLAIQYMGSASTIILNEAQIEVTEDAELPTDVKAIKASMQYGFIGDSAVGEKIYYTMNDTSTQAVLGIIDDDGAMILTGNIVDDADGNTTLTDVETGDTLVFTYKNDTDKDGKPCITFNMAVNETSATLYPEEVSIVLDEIAKH